MQKSTLKRALCPFVSVCLMNFVSNGHHSQQQTGGNCWSLHGSAVNRTQSTDVVSHLISTVHTEEEVELLTTNTQLDHDVRINERAHINTHKHTCRPAPNNDPSPPGLNRNTKAIPQISMSTITKDTSTYPQAMIAPLLGRLELEEKHTHSQVLGMNQNDVVRVPAIQSLRHEAT